MAKRGINSVKIILEYSRSQGFDSKSILSGTGLDSNILNNDKTQIDDHQELTVLNNLLKLIPDPFRLGVELGRCYQLTSYGIVGLALLSSSTLRQATTLGLRYLSLTYAFSEIEVRDEGGYIAWVFSCNIPGDLGHLALIRDIWAVNVILRELFPDNRSPFELQMECDEPEYSKKVGKVNLEKNLGSNISFNALCNAYVGPVELLDLPLLKADSITARICEEQCNELLHKRKKWQPVSVLVRDTVLKKGLNVSMEDVANSLTRTSRTLHRQLKEEGTSWRQIRDDMLVSISESLLLEPIQLDEVADRLGFSDAANYSASFKRCTGVSPKAYKKLLQQKNKFLP